MYVNIAVLKETSPGEHRVALAPGVVPNLTKLGGRLYMEFNAGEAIGLADADFFRCCRDCGSDRAGRGR